MNIAEIAVVAIPCVAIGAFLGHTLLRGDTEARFNVSKPGDDAFTIARLTDDVAAWRGDHDKMQRAAAYWRDYSEELRAENRKLRDLLGVPDAGLQSSGGIDPTVSA